MRLATINKFATVIETERSRAPLGKILGLNSFNMESILSYDPDFFETQEDAKHNLDLVSSVGIKFEGNLHAQWFNIFMMDLLRKFLFACFSCVPVVGQEVFVAWSNLVDAISDSRSTA